MFDYAYFTSRKMARSEEWKGKNIKFSISSFVKTEIKTSQ